MKSSILLITFLAILLFINNSYSQVTQEWVARYHQSTSGVDLANSIAVDGSGNVYVTGGSMNDFITIRYNSSGVQQWLAVYNGPGNGLDEANAITVDGSGNVYVTGLSGSGTSYDYATIKYNSSGVQQWVARYNGPGNNHDETNSIAVDVSGNVYVTGSSIGSGTNYDYATIKYNSSGVQQWIQRYNGTSNLGDWANALVLDGSGDVYVTGQSAQSGSAYDYLTIKYSSSGVQQWVQTYNGPANTADGANAIALDGSGNVYVTGGSLISSPNYDYATVKYNSSGVQQWVQRYNGPGNGSDAARSIGADDSGNVYVTGWSWGSGTNYDYATIKYNPSGVQQWVQRYDGPGSGNDLAYSIAINLLGNVYVAGQSTGSGTGSDNATIKYNSAGVLQWVQRYNGPGNSEDFATSIAVDSSGNVSVTGSSTGIGTGSDYATIKYNSSGVQLWVQRYDGPGNGSDVASSIALDGSGNVYITGGSMGFRTNYDYATIKYSQTVGILPITNEIPNKFNLSQNYPNPFNPTTKIKFALPSNPEYSGSNVKLVVNSFILKIIPKNYSRMIQFSNNLIFK